MNSLLFIALLAVGQPQAEKSADRPVTTEVELVGLLHTFFAQQAGDYKFSLGSAAKHELVLEREPIMSWSGDDSWFGDVFVWTSKGRPELIGCLGSWNVGNESRGMFQEFHSLSTEPLSGVRIGRRHTWTSERSGITPQAVPEAPVPAATKRLRSLQMRALARDFSASMKSDSGMQTLRMQAPLFPYTTETGEDGAIFPFVWTVGTDPEVLLVLETRRTDKGQQWFYAPVRFSWRECWVQHKDTEVWHAEQYREAEGGALQLKEPYVTLRVEDVTLEELRKAYEPKKPSDKPANPTSDF